MKNLVARVRRYIREKTSKLRKIRSSKENSRIASNWHLPTCIFKSQPWVSWCDGWIGVGLFLRVNFVFLFGVMFSLFVILWLFGECFCFVSQGQLGDAFCKLVVWFAWCLLSLLGGLSHGKMVSCFFNPGVCLMVRPILVVI